MTIHFQILFTIASTWCLATNAQTEHINHKLTNATAHIQFEQKDTASWVDNFRQFRSAVFLKDKMKAKAFFDFPIKDSSNEIWYLVYGGNEKAINHLGSKIKPFTEADFEKYFDKIFSKEFIKALLKVKTEELYKKGTFQTPESKDSATSYILYSDFDKKERMLSLNFASNTAYKDDQGEPVDGGESNILYYFRITKNGRINLTQIRLAG